MSPKMHPVWAAMLVVATLAGCGRGVDSATAVNEARALIDAGKPGEARILLKNALVDAPGLVGAREVLARIALEEGDVRAAAAELSVNDGAELSAEARSLKARIALELGNVDEAEDLLSGGQIPDVEPQGTLLRASVLSARGSLAEAVTLLREAQRAHPQSEEVAVQIAGSLASAGNLDGALAELDRFLASATNNRAGALRARGDLRLRQGASMQAVEDLQAAVKAAPANWPLADRRATELMIADAMLAAGQMNEARAQIDRVVKAWPGMLGTEVLQAHLALLDGRATEAVDRLERAIEVAPDNIRLRHLLVDALTRSGNISRASEILENGAAEAGDFSARRALAALWMQQGRPDRVITLLEDDDADDMLMAARLAQTRARSTIADLTQRLASHPDDEEARAGLATAQIANGEPAAALATLGPLPNRGFTPALAAARMAALLASDDEFGVNSLVGRLLDSNAGADVAVLLGAADVAQRQRKAAVVSRLLDRAIVLDAANSDVQLRRASLAFDARRYDEAEGLLRDLVAREPRRIDASVALARVAEARGDLDAARRALEEGVRRDASAMEPSLMLADLEVRVRRPEKAGQVLDAMIGAQKDKPAQAAASNAAGLMLMSARMADGARARFRHAVEAEPGNAEYWFNLGRSQLALADAVAARESFIKSARQQPDSIPAVSGVLSLTRQQGDFAVASQLAGALVRSLPESARAWVLKGDVDAGVGRFEAARAAYAKATSLRPSSAAAVGEFRARVRLRTPRPEAPLETWLARASEDVTSRRLLAEHYLSVGKLREARGQLEALLQQAPADVSTLNNLAWVLRETDEPRAEKLALQAQAIAPDNPAVADTLGMIQLARGETQAALPLLARAAAGLPEDPGVQYRYALALRRTGQAAEARTLLARVLGKHKEFAEREAARRLQEEL